DEAKELKKLRKRWLKLPNQLEVDALIARADWRQRFPQLREVIDWVQDLRKWFERTYDKPARAALWQLIERARASALAPLQGVGGTFSRWFEPIARYIRHRYTNGMTEGFNNKIGYPRKAGHPAPSITYREGLTTLPGHGQLVNL